MGELVVVTGPPGAGKSTVARILSGTFEPSARVAGDDFFAFLDRGAVPPWTPAAHRQNQVVIDAAAAAVGRLVAGGYTVVYDGVVGPWFVDAFARSAGLRRLHYAVLLPPEQVCLHRVESRVGHGFTDLPAARHMHGEFADAAVDSRHVFRQVDDVTAIAAAVRRAVDDRLLLLEVD